MRAYVLPDARLARHARRSVWLSIDTENPRNAAFLERFPVAVWPTFLVVDPRSERAILKWLGSASAAQLDALLEDAAARTRAGPAAALARADRALAQGRLDEAVAAYRAALAQGGPGWPRRPRAVESLVLGLQEGGRLEECADAARTEAPTLARGRSFANVAAIGLGCATSAPADAPWRADGLAALEPLAREAVDLPGLLADDRSGLHEALTDARAAQGDPAGAREAAGRWWSFLSQEERTAPTAEARASLDSARVGAALALGDPARALPALEASQRALPRDYNPRARRALLLRELGRLPEARAAAREALARAYGPRKLKVYQLVASIEEQAGDRRAAAAALDAALACAAALPAAQRDEKAVAALRERRAALDGHRAAR